MKEKTTSKREFDGAVAKQYLSALSTILLTIGIGVFLRLSCRFKCRHQQFTVQRWSVFVSRLLLLQAIMV